MRDVKIPNWLNKLPLAPEFRPTDTEFADPIAYISKIEKEASAFGICKVIPPLPRPSKKYVVGNLNRSLSKCPELGLGVSVEGACEGKKLRCDGGEGEVRAVFTTRQQELGQEGGKRGKGGQRNQNVAVPLHKQVWQSGEIYTLEQFESKSRVFARSQLGTVKDVSAAVIEALFWKAASEKPIYVEYANDVPGSGFGEPEGSARFSRRMGRRTVKRNYEGGSETKKVDKATLRSNDENKGASNECISISAVATVPPNTSPEDNSSQSSRRKNSCTGNEMEGSSGWKLSNSPWNLQVIARSPGSMTRFMPDDIPGVTSPMVYIGMLFSWFAWHVEDHELHSMNFLHTGSSKTWYSVPGDYAFTFEEVIRMQAYGGNIDRLAALTLLGEKTTLVSPEVVVASGIPCCRLVQNPGEFVITFPRAYHVGFSHGFNCGEAANFGTPKWLSVAKEAAVRRAAMNHLPMLSHQQLLYLLTMSFISRVPRFLLPGVRSSRLRDRQKEERELLVKKAFIEDILNENIMLSCLLKKTSSCQAVLWNIYSLPPSVKGSDCIGVTVSSRPSEEISPKTDTQQTFSQSLYLESLNEYDLDDDDDLSSDFHVDSGALPCVACGVLGFPFMSVIQPSKEASMDFLSSNFLGVSHPAESNVPFVSNSMFDVSNSDGMHKEKIFSACERTNPAYTTTLKSGEGIHLTKDRGQVSMDAKRFSTETVDELKTSSNLVQHPTEASSVGTKLDEGSTTTYLRPRIFCLEHAIQVVELMHSKGGAKVLVICHSDFQKIKAHAAAVAEDIGSNFNYQEVPLENATREELSLINLAIDDEEQKYCGEDWTSQVKINLQHSISLQKKFPFEKLQHALTLNGLFVDTATTASALRFEWRSKKCRSKRRKLYQSDQINSSERIIIKEGVALVANSDVQVAEKHVEMLHYSRRRFKSKQFNFSGASKASGDPGKLHEPVASAEPVKDTGKATPIVGRVFSSEESEQREGHRCCVSPRECDEVYVSPEVSEPPRVAVQIAEDVEVAKDTEEGSSDNEISNIETTDDILEQHKIQDTGDALMEEVSRALVLHRVGGKRSSDKNERVYSETSAGSLLNAVQSDEYVQVGGEDQKEEICSENEIFNSESVDHVSVKHNILENGDTLMKEVSDSRMLDEIKFHEENTDTTEKCYSETAAGSPTVAVQTSEMIQVQREIQIRENYCSVNNSFELETTDENHGHPNILDNEAAAKVVSDPTSSGVSFADSISVGNLDEQMDSVVKNLRKNNEACDGANFVCVQKSADDGNEMQKHASRNDTGANELSTVSEEGHDFPRETCEVKNMNVSDEKCPLQEETESQTRSVGKNARKRKREADLLAENGSAFDGFVKSPCEGLRPRGFKDKTMRPINMMSVVEMKPARKKSGNSIDDSNNHENKKAKKVDVKPARNKSGNSTDDSNKCKNEKANKEASHKCDVEGCGLSFQTKAESLLHKHNRCHHDGCGKKFSSHKNAVRHLCVHDDNRPLKCPWEGCTKSFKWAWARTEHIRVHTGEKPYECKFDGCGLTFRFVSDYSRHRRKTGHYVNPPT